MANVLVFCEQKDGQLKKVSREALSAGRELAGAMGGDLVAAALGSNVAGFAEEIGKYGATKLYVVTSGDLDAYQTETWTSATEAILRTEQPAVLVMAATAAGKDLAPRLGARLDSGVASEAIKLEWIDGKLRARRPMYSGKVFGTVEVDGQPAIVTLRANAAPATESGGAAAEVTEVPWEGLEPKGRLRSVEATAAGELSIAEADIIVSGGRGLKEADNFSHIRDLAQALGAAVGASRATVDAGWIDHQHQVGQTGRVVNPNLYIAVGISGAIQHLAGMQSSKHIIAINKDKEAPIFKVADLGVVGDLFEILPVLTEEVKKAK